MHGFDKSMVRLCVLVLLSGLCQGADSNDPENHHVEPFLNGTAGNSTVVGNSTSNDGEVLPQNGTTNDVNSTEKEPSEDGTKPDDADTEDNSEQSSLGSAMGGLGEDSPLSLLSCKDKSWPRCNNNVAVVSMHPQRKSNESHSRYK